MIADVIDHIEYRTGIRTDGLTMSIYSSLMVAATPICNSIFSAMLNGSGYNQAADVALAPPPRPPVCRPRSLSAISGSRPSAISSVPSS